MPARPGVFRSRREAVVGCGLWLLIAVLAIVGVIVAIIAIARAVFS